MYTDAAAEIGRNSVSTRFSLSMEMSRLTRDGTAKPVSRETKFSGANGDREIMYIFPVQLTTSRIGNLTRLILCDSIGSFCPYSQCSHLNLLTNIWVEGLDAFRFFLRGK